MMPTHNTFNQLLQRYLFPVQSLFDRATRSSLDFGEQDLDGNAAFLAGIRNRSAPLAVIIDCVSFKDADGRRCPRGQISNSLVFIYHGAFSPDQRTRIATFRTLPCRELNKS